MARIAQLRCADGHRMQWNPRRGSYVHNRREATGCTLAAHPHATTWQ